MSSLDEPGQRGVDLRQARVLWVLVAGLWVLDVIDLIYNGVSHGAIIGAGFLGAIAALVEVDTLLRHDRAEGNIAKSSARVGRALVGAILGLSIAGAALTALLEFTGASEVKGVLFAAFGAMFIASVRAFTENSPRRIGTLSVVVAACAVIIGAAELYDEQRFSRIGSHLHAPQHHVVFLVSSAALGLAIGVGLWATTRWNRGTPTVAGPVAKVRLRA